MQGEGNWGEDLGGRSTGQLLFGPVQRWFATGPGGWVGGHGEGTGFQAEEGACAESQLFPRAG